MDTEILDTWLNQNNGFYKISDAQALGFSKEAAVQYIKKANLTKVSHGIYNSEDAWPDRLYLLQLRNKKIIFSHETALYLNGLSDRESFMPIVTVKRGYNASHLKKDNVKVHTVISSWFEIGLTNAKTPAGNTVRVYDPERCICDIVREKNKMDIQVFQTAMVTYFQGREKDIHRLMNYAEQFGIENKIRQYTEVLL